jgi:uncharacterized protein YqeY
VRGIEAQSRAVVNDPSQLRQAFNRRFTAGTSLKKSDTVSRKPKLNETSILPMISSQPDAAEVMRQKLQRDLRAAIKGRQTLEVAVLRGLIAAIDNAGAVPLAAKSEPTQHEVERRHLDSGDVQAILRCEYEAHQTAASEFARLGRSVEAERANFAMAVVSRYLSIREGSDSIRDVRGT